MVNETTIHKLYEMRLSAMAQAYRQHMEDPSLQSLSFEDRFGLLVDTEWTTRKNSRLARLIHVADFPISGACIEDIEYHADRKLNREQILQLSTCSYISEKHNIILLGATGAGKTYLSCALGMAACKNFYSVKYIRLPDLLDELAVSRGEGIFRKVMRTYKKISLLILDEWLLTPLSETETRDLLEIIEARYKHCSTIFSSQFSPAGWIGKIGEGPLADAILDRIVHNSYTIFMDGTESMRKRKGIC
ncbi:IS21-like element helper ATPase IstB [Treponema primitia]|jgi:DNA replication protein DnaC|uniref:IS21-like element helper ATPase IstB n=1 Tax=Treponema primitia TaxID=88058 RepID=UPI0039809F5D